MKRVGIIYPKKKESELSKLTKQQLVEMAAEASIDISSCNTKDDIIAVIEAVCGEV